jgi:hypothetical protein
VDAVVPAPYSPEKVRAALQTALLAAQEVQARVALTGGTALEAWGVARATQDVDLVFLLPPGRFSRFQRALQLRGARTLEVRGDARTAWMRVLIRGVQIDWLRAWDLPTQRALRRSVIRSVLGIRLRVLRPEDLILLKLRVGRPRDLDDAVRLYVIGARQMDQPYLRRYIRQLRLGREWAYLTRSVPQEESGGL